MIRFTSLAAFSVTVIAIHFPFFINQTDGDGTSRSRHSTLHFRLRPRKKPHGISVLGLRSMLDQLVQRIDGTEVPYGPDNLGDDVIDLLGINPLYQLVQHG